MIRPTAATGPRLAGIAIVCLSVIALAQTPLRSAAGWVRDTAVGTAVARVLGRPAPARAPGGGGGTAPPAPIIGATKAFSWPGTFDANNNSKADPGEKIRYTVTVANTGDANATNLHVLDTPDANTTFVPGSIVVSPLAANESYESVGNLTLTSASIGADCNANPLHAVTCNDTLNGATLTHFGATLGTAGGTAVANPVTTSNNGTVTLNADGTFVYDPAAGFEGADQFFYTVRNSTVTPNLTDVGKVTINVGTFTDTVAHSNGMVWFVSPGGGGGGRQANPMTLAAFNTANTGAGTNPNDGDTIFLFEGAHTGPVSLRLNQKFIGQDATASVPTLGGPALQPGNAYPNSNPTGTNVSITAAGNGVTLNANNTLAGFVVGNVGAANAAIVGGAAGTVSVREVAINTNGGALRITTSGTFINDPTFPGFTSVTSTGGTNGVRLTGVLGTLALGSGALSGSFAPAFLVGDGAGGANTGGAATITYSGTITSTGTARAVDIEDRIAGAGDITLSGAITHASGNASVIFVDQVAAGTILFSGAGTYSGGNSNAVSLTNNGATINFTAGMAITTTSGTGFLATGGGTVSATQNNTTIVNTIASSSGQALNVANTTIGASHLTFRSISSGASASNGITLDTTGSSGGLIVVGDGTDTSLGGNGTGGTIAGKSGGDLSRTSGIGIYLNSTSNVVLRRMTINGTNQNFGIRGFTVNNFTLEYSTVSGTNGNNPNDNGADESGEGAIYFGSACGVGGGCTNGVTGAATLTGDVIGGGAANGLSVVNISGTLNRLTVDASSFPVTPNGSNHSMNVNTLGAGTTVNVTVKGSTFAGAPGDMIAIVGQAGTIMDVIFGGTTATPGTAPGNAVSNSHAENIFSGSNLTVDTQGAMTYHILGNTFRDADGSAVTLQKAQNGTVFDGFIDNNRIGVAGAAGSGSATANGLFFSYAGTGTASVTVTNNQIRNWEGGAAMFADNTGGSYTANFRIQGNTIEEPGSGSFASLAITNGSPGSTDTVNVCAEIGGAGGLKNTFSGDVNVADVYLTASGDIAASHTFNLPNYAAFAAANGGNSFANVQAFVAGNNTKIGTLAYIASADAPNTVAGFTGTGTGCTTPISMNRPGAGRPEYVARAETPSGSNPMGSLVAAFRVQTFVSSMTGRLPRLSVPAADAVVARVLSAAGRVTHAVASPLLALVRRGIDSVSVPVYADAPPAVDVNVGVLPFGKTLKVVFDVTVNAGAKTQYSNTATINWTEAPGTLNTAAAVTPGVAPTKLVITQVNGGSNPVAGVGFDVVVQAQQSDSSVGSVVVDTAFTLTRGSGSGTLGGTVTGTILAGSSSKTVVGVTYTKAETPVTLIATRDSGDNLTAGTSAPFTVDAGTTAAYRVTPANVNIIVGVNGAVAVQKIDSNGNSTSTGGPASVTITGRNVADTAGNANVQVIGGATVTFNGSGLGSFNVKNDVAESFKVRADGGGFTGTSATMKTYPMAAAGQVIISEFRFRGPGAGANDEYFTFYNNTDTAILVGTTDGSAGWAFAGADGTTRFTILTGTLLPARSYYLAVNNNVSNGFSLGAFPAGIGGGTVGSGDIQYQLDIAHSGASAGVALFRSNSVLDIGNRLDAVGYVDVDTLYKEGAGLPSGGAEQSGTLQYAFTRNPITGVPADTDNNAADFKLVETSAAGTIQLGAPGPRSTSSPVRTSLITVGTIPLQATTVRDNLGQDWAIPGGGTLNFPTGVLNVPKRFTNTTGHAITRLRVRIVDLTTAPVSGGAADMRVIDGTGSVFWKDSAHTSRTPVGYSPELKPMLVELPQAQLQGGGLNTTLTLDLSTLPGGNLANGATVDVHFRLGVITPGSYRFFIMMEALP